MNGLLLASVIVSLAGLLALAAAFTRKRAHWLVLLGIALIVLGSLMRWYAIAFHAG